MNNYNGKHIHFIGCGGIGMLGLALIVKEKGAVVTGSDIAKSKNTSILNDEYITTFTGHDKSYLPYLTNVNIKPEDCIIVYSSAVKDNNPELATARSDGIPCYRRGVFLGMLARDFESVVSVAGSHGKTTVTSMITHVLKKLGRNPGYYIGGLPVGTRKNASAGDGKTFITEADESDLSITHLHPTVGIILNLDNDHAWNVGGVEKLLDGFRIYARQSVNFLPGSDNFPSGFLDDLKKDKIKFQQKAHAGHLDFSKFCEYEKNNILTVLTVAESLGENIEMAFKALSDFPGVERRLNTIYKSEQLVVIEDYAHHPTEICAVISVLRMRYPDRKLVLAFQPHREKRLKYCFDGFAFELRKADYCYVLPVYGAWEDISEHLDVKLVEAIGNNKAKLIGPDWHDAASTVMDGIAGKTLLVIMGAGDINKMISSVLEKCQMLNPNSEVGLNDK